MQIKYFNKFTEELDLCWSSIQDESNNYLFQDLLWLKRWADLNKNISINVAVAYDNKGPAIIFPLGLRSCLGLKLLEFLGGDVSDYLGPVIRDDLVESEIIIRNAWQATLLFLPTHDVINLRKLPEFYGGKINCFVRQLEPRHTGMAYSVSLPGSFAEYERNLRSSFRLDTKRRKRRLSEVGEINFSVIDPRSKEWDIQIEQLISQKKVRLKEQSARDIFINRENYQFYKTKFLFEGGNSILTLATLKLDDEIIALHWGALYKKKFYWIIPSFKVGRWNFYSPGRLLLYELIEWCISNGCSQFDFTIGGEEYKREWCNSQMKIYQLLKAKSWKGRLYVFFYKIINVLKSNKILKKYYLVLEHNYRKFLNARPPY